MHRYHTVQTMKHRHNRDKWPPKPVLTQWRKSRTGCAAQQKWEPAYCISMMFFLWIPLWVCFSPCPHHVMFSCEKCFINDLPRLHVSFEMLWQKTLSARERKKARYLQTANSLPQGFADFISGALLFGFHSLGFEATIKAYVWYCVMWFRPREKQSFIF